MEEFDELVSLVLGELLTNLPWPIKSQTRVRHETNDSTSLNNSNNSGDYHLTSFCLGDSSALLYPQP